MHKITIQDMRRERKRKWQVMGQKPYIEKVEWSGNMVIMSPHLGDTWKKIQSRFIEKNTPKPFDYIQFQVEPGCRHLRALGRCLQYFNKHCKKGDICVVFDSDAFPINSEWAQMLKFYLEQKSIFENNGDRAHEFVAVQRLENPYKYRFIAHPCFCAWYHGINIIFKEISSNPYIEGYETRSWKKLHRTNRINYHQQLYGIYGDMVYHHGAGSRNVTRQRFFKVPNGVNPERFFYDQESFIKELI